MLYEIVRVKYVLLVFRTSPIYCTDSSTSFVPPLFYGKSEEGLSSEVVVRGDRDFVFNKLPNP